jgi:4-amino-4-deoxy-L-arabinose transferase-like glycosyltransferase
VADTKTPDQKPKPVPIGSGPMAIALGSIRNTEAYLRWQGAQWVIALNLTALVALLYRFLAKPDIAELVVLAIGCGGVATLDYEWYNVVRRNGRLFDFWNRKFAEHEAVNGIEGGTKIFTANEYQSLIGSRERLQRRLERISVFFMAGWSACAIVLVTLAFVALRGGLK